MSEAASRQHPGCVVLVALLLAYYLTAAHRAAR